MVFDIEYPNGPWKKLFFGNYDDYSLSIYFNQDGFLISEILNNDKTKSVLSISQIIGVFGDAENFVESLPRNAIYLIEHGTKSNQKYVLLLSDQEVLNYTQKEVSDFINNQFKKLTKDSKSILNIASSYEITLKTYNELTANMKKEIFSNPLSIFSFAFKNRLDKTYTTQEQDVSKKEMFLGFYKTTNKKVIEPINLFSKTFVFGNSKKSLRVILEDFSMNKTNCVVFTSDESFNNLKYPNENLEEQEKNRSATFGFPTLNYKLGGNLSVNLSDLPENAFQELFGIKSEIISNLIKDVIKEKQSITIDNLIKDISEYKPNEQYTSYNINLACRIVNIIKQEKPGVFIGDFSVSDFFKDHNRNLGTINIVSLNKDDKLTNKLILYNTLKKISVFKNESKLAIFLSDLDASFSRTDNDTLSKEFINLIQNDNLNYYVFSAQTEVDLDPGLLNSFTSKMSNLENDEVGIIIKDAKPFRFVLRPTFSKLE